MTMYRYRMDSGLSRHVLPRFETHRAKLGTIKRIVGRRYLSTRGKGDGRFTTDHECITVYGENGTARFSGCCWGYTGEGPRAVHALLVACGVPDGLARLAAFESERQQPGIAALATMPQRSQIDWEIKVKVNCF